MTGAASRRRVHWFSWQPTPYNDTLFRALARDPGIELSVYYRSRSVTSHPWKSALAADYGAHFYHVFLGLDWRALLLAVRDREALFVIGGWDHPTTVALLTLLRLSRASYVLWTDTPDLTRKRGPLYARTREAWLRWVFAGATRIMGTGRPALTRLKEMGAAEKILSNFPYWIDIDAYKRRLTGRRSATGSIRFVSSGRIRNAVKGHDIAIRALALAARSAAVEFEYCIAGAGPDEEELARLLRSLGLEHRVKLLGWLEPDQLSELYSDADVLIHPSPIHEPYGVVVIEAMAAGLAVMASDRTGAALDRIEHGTNGLIHPAGDVDELAAQIVSLLREPQRIAELASKARATAERWPVQRGVETIREIMESDRRATC